MEILLNRKWKSENRVEKIRKRVAEMVKERPSHKEALEFMSICYFSPWKEKWAYIASNATNKDCLY